MYSVPHITYIDVYFIKLVEAESTVPCGSREKVIVQSFLYLCPT